MEVRQSDCYIPDPKGWVDGPANAASSCNGIKLKFSAKLRPKCHSFRILVGETSVPQTELYSNYPLQILWLSKRESGVKKKKFQLLGPVPPYGRQT